MGMISKIKMMMTSQKTANDMLFLGCQTGDVKAVKQALWFNADVNAKKKLGTYSDGVGGRNNPDWEGDVYATPIVVAATGAMGADRQDNYQEIIRLLIDKGAKTSTVVSGVERVWEDDDYHICGFSPDTETPFHHSLGTVLKNRKHKKLGHCAYSVPAEMYPISDEMALFLHPLATDELARREQMILEKTDVERYAREDEVYIAGLKNEILPARQVMKLRAREEKARLKIAKKLLLEKYRFERS